MENTHNGSIFQPYDPSDTIGDTAPTAAKPPKKNKCGAFGQVLLVVVAVAVAYVTAGAAAGIIGQAAGSGASLLGHAAAGVAALGAPGGAALASVAKGAIGGFSAGGIGGAVGSIASQAVGVATGIQDKFSWTSVASSALAGGLGGGGVLEKSGAFLQGAGTNAISQAAAIALGPQSKFSWASVAAAGAGSWAGGKFGASKFGQVLASSSTIAGQIGTGTAAAIANAATRTALGDGNFGDNIRAAIPDVIGQALGGAIGARIGAALNGTTQAEIELRTTLVSQNAEGFRARFGDMSEVDDYEQALLAVAASPGDKRLQREYNRATRAMLEANSSDPGVADFLQKIHPDTNVVNTAADEDGPVMEKVRVTSDRDFLFGSTVDGAGIWVGEVQHEIGGKVGQFIEENPGVGIAIQIADGAYAVAAPAKYLGGMALDHFEEEASGFIASQMDGPNMWASDKAQAGGDGFVFSAGVLLGGLGALGYSSKWRAPLPKFARKAQMHILDGEIGKTSGGKASGKGGHDPNSSNVQIRPGTTPSKPDANGVVRAEIDVWDPKSGGWVHKRATEHTFFPASWSRSKIIKEVREAGRSVREEGFTGEGKFVGRSPSGVEMQIVFDSKGQIVQSHPIYQGP
jgi:hypothetical protein